MTYHSLAPEYKEQIIKDFRDSTVERDEMQASLARMGLSQIQGQFPSHIKVQGTSISEKILKVIKKYLTELKSKDAHPEMMFGGDKQPLSTMALEQGFENRIFDINHILSDDTTQGIVYRIEVHPNSSLHVIDVIDSIFGRRHNVHAVMKKSPIYSIYLWKQYFALKRMVQAYYSHPNQHNRYRFSQEEFVLFSEFAKDSHLAISYEMLNNVEKMESELERLETEMVKQQDDIYHNDAYVDALGYYAGNKMVEHNLSPFFPLLYGTFRAFDSGFFNARDVEMYGQEINEFFPVQVTIMQPLDGSFGSLIDEQWFDTPKKMSSLTAQVIIGLNNAQKVFQLVHNDFHAGNLMYENVSEDHVLYFVKNARFYKVDTGGKLFKMIDFGRATMRIDDIIIASETQPRVTKSEWDTYNPNNDLLQFTIVLALSFGFEKIPLLLQQFIRQVTQCGKENILDTISKCKGDKRCLDWVQRIKPFVKNSECRNAIPSYHMNLLEEFIIDKSKVPHDAIIYPIL